MAFKVVKKYPPSSSHAIFLMIAMVTIRAHPMANAIANTKPNTVGDNSAGERVSMLSTYRDCL
ncbi:MAG: hypothetical protein ACRC5V_07325 [Aeromonas sp.]